MIKADYLFWERQKLWDRCRSAQFSVGASYIVTSGIEMWWHIGSGLAYQIQDQHYD